MTNCRTHIYFLLVVSILLFSFDKIKRKKSVKKTPAPTKISTTNASVKKSPYYIIINKSDSTLKVYDEKGLFASYPVVFGGNNLGDKHMQGDKKTPDGKFKILGKKNHPKWGFELSLDYPNEESYKVFNERKKNGWIPLNANIGCCIAIHGTPEDKEWLIDYGQNWTDGCISLKNAHMVELYNDIPVGTLVTIQKFKSTEQNIVTNNVSQFASLQKPFDPEVPTEEDAYKIVKEYATVAKPAKKITRERYRRESVAFVRESTVIPDSYLTIIQNARNYFNENEWVSAKIWYSKAHILNTEPTLTDTIAIIDGYIRFDSALNAATIIENQAIEHFNITEGITTPQKITICNESIELFTKAIFAFKDALQIDSTAGAPRLRIGDCWRFISKVKNKLDLYETGELSELYKRSRAAADTASSKKDYPGALKAYEEAFTYIQNEKLQKAMYNYIGELDYIRDKIRIMRDQVSIMEAKNNK